MAKREKTSGSWTKGTSGNPGGRFKGLERIFRDELNAVRERYETHAADGTATEEMLDGYRAAFRRLWTIAMKGEDKDSLAALKLLFERTHGLPSQKVTITEDTDNDEVDWSAVPLDRRRELLETLTLVAPSDDASEH